MPGVILHAIALAFAVGTVAEIGSASKISQPLRKWFFSRKKPWSTWIFDLISCPFCTSVWLASAGTLIFGVRLMPGFWLLDWGCTSLAVSAASMLPVLWIRRALRS